MPHHKEAIAALAWTASVCEKKMQPNELKSFHFINMHDACRVFRCDKLADSYSIIATINCPIPIQCRY